MADGSNRGLAAPGDDGGDVRLTTGYPNYVLGVLFFVYVLNFIDRQVLSVFVEPIKEEMNASDTQMGLLLGFGFALFYMIAGIPIARWADRVLVLRDGVRVGAFACDPDAGEHAAADRLARARRQLRESQADQQKYRRGFPTR